MRHLRRIIFLNSANIPYAEVMLDGNVHFAGTQGVGKSTILRALLFFYNADKMRLGIQQGQKSFEEFYFRYSNSYIVYEVKAGHGAYTIIACRNQGRVVYRFVDAAYQKEWFVSNDGRVESDWIRIRERIGSRVDISAKIDAYEMYRNIIFGNTHDRSHRFDKYAIVESSKYQNIPRSIQNVFLNSKLDADFVKNTIIQSMSETEDVIALSAYRHLVADFEREFDEIDCWYRKDARGEVVVRAKAGKVIETYRLLVALEYEMKQTWHRLNHAVGHTREQIPLVEEELHRLQEKQNRIKGKLDGAQDDYQKEHDDFTRKISVCDMRLGDIRTKRKRYGEIGISSMLELDAQEPKVESEMLQKNILLGTLQEQFKDITEKYKALYATLDAEWRNYELKQKEDLQRFRDGIQTERDRAMARRDSRKQSIDAAYADWMSDSDKRMTVLQGECNRADKRLSELQYWHPMSGEIEGCKEDIRNISAQEQSCKSKLAIVGSELKSMRQEAQARCDRIERDFSLKQDAMHKELEQMKEELSATEEILKRWKGSLYEWLTLHKPGWEENIGKVVDEQDVLYAGGLNPELADGGNLFGVRLNLDAIPAHHRSPDEYRQMQKQQADAIAAKKKELVSLQIAFEKDTEAIRKSYKARISDKQQEETNLNVQLEQMPVRQKDALTRLHRLECKEAEMVAAECEKRKAAHNEALLHLEREKTSRSQQYEKHRKILKAADSEYNSALKDMQKRFDDFRRKQEEEWGVKKNDADDRKQMIERQERDELKGKGADTRAIELCRKDMDVLQQKLDKIKGQRHFVIEYRKDEAELFSREEDFREEKRQLDAKAKQTFQAFEDKRKKYERELSEQTNLIGLQRKNLDTMNDGLKQYEQLCGIENIIPDTLIQDDAVEKNNNPCVDLVTAMRGALNKKRQKHEDLKRAINSFSTHFGSNNTFHFALPQYDDEYMEFAVNLQDFVENNKIEDYRERVSEHYNTILRSISREVGLLMNHSAEIKGIINDVNRDFQERNFAGVIRSIELRAEESSDRLLLLLRSIRDFTEENSLSMGELNLFSGGDRGQVNVKVVEYLKRFMKQLQKEPSRTELTLSDTFRLQFRIQENDNNTGWVERINNVGSDGTDILVKAMVNIMLINVFKTKASRKQGDFVIHCMMDEIGKLHPSNVAGILQFANVRNIYLINSSPMGYNADIYKYNYLLTKDSKSQTHIKRLMTINM